MNLDWLIIGGRHSWLTHRREADWGGLHQSGSDPDRGSMRKAPRSLEKPNSNHWNDPPAIPCRPSSGNRSWRSETIRHQRQEADPQTLRAPIQQTLAQVVQPLIAIRSSRLYKLTDLHIRDRAVKCLVDCDKAVVKLAGGTEMHSRNVVLAIGSGDQTQWPEWAPTR